MIRGWLVSWTKGQLFLVLALWHVGCTALLYLAAFRDMPRSIVVYICLWCGLSAIWRFRAPHATEDVVLGRGWCIVHGLFFHTLIFVEMGLLFWLFLKTPWLSFLAGSIWIAGYWLNPIFTLRRPPTIP